MEQMAARGVTIAHIRAALLTPVYREATYQDREAIYGPDVLGRTLKVIAVIGAMPRYIITVIWNDTSRVQRLIARRRST